MTDEPSRLIRPPTTLTSLGAAVKPARALRDSLASPLRR
jgi:hypothetical protein